MELEFGSDDGKALLTGGHAGETLAVSYALGQFASVVFLELGFIVHEL